MKGSRGVGCGELIRGVKRGRGWFGRRNEG